MDELTLALIGAGAVVVAGVFAYNGWQSARARRRMPWPVPEELTESGYRASEPMPGEDESLFIQPPHPRTPAPPREPAFARREPSFSGGAFRNVEQARSAAHDTMRAAAFAAPPDMPVDLQADSTAPPLDDGSALEGTPAGVTSDAPGAAPGAVAPGLGDGPGARALGSAAAQRPAGRDTPGAPVIPAISGAPPTVVDRRIDCLVPIRLSAPLGAERILPHAQRLRRAGSKPVFIEGRVAPGPEAEGQDGQWQLPRAKARYDELRAAVQLANRSGPLNELEFSEFVAGVHAFADAIDGAPDFPDMSETVAMARELDVFAAQCDAQLSVNVLSDGAPWSANYVQAVAAQDGLLLSRDGMRFVKLDARQNPVFMLQFGDTNFLRDDLTYQSGQLLTLLLDVPVADEDMLPFKLMCDYAASLAQRLGGRVVDDQRRPLSATALQAIDQQLMTLYGKLEQAGMAAGSLATRRLFSS